MDIVILGGLVVAFLSLILGFSIDGGSVTSLIHPTAALIILGGTFGAVAVSFPGNVLKKFPKVIKIAFQKRESNIAKNILYFKEISTKTRKEGLLSIEAEVSESNVDPFIKQGLQFVVDGIEQSTVESIMKTKLEQMVERHEDGMEIFSAAGGYAPTMGIIGTVMGLVLVVGNLSDPTLLGPKIASAFMATLYGIATANIIWLPIANKLKMLNKQEVIEKEMIIEAILLIQQGVNPNTLVNKLEGFLEDGNENLLRDDK
ncbi:MULTISPECIES: flagellar motor protein [Clostridium]|uniref:Flagellar motor protein n=1 Tax=Clostridium cibarium TaxID=2762247 RepID=A0ABR8PZ87_9CLOT|nr:MULTISPECIES: flagellar motor protein [Clostridium]MBD7913486.1 flagellar motor protein [Clostridium cibarium]